MILSFSRALSFLLNLCLAIPLDLSPRDVEGDFTVVIDLVMHEVNFKGFYAAINEANNGMPSPLRIDKVEPPLITAYCVAYSTGEKKAMRVSYDTVLCADKGWVQAFAFTSVTIINRFSSYPWSICTYPLTDSPRTLSKPGGPCARGNWKEVASGFSDFRPNGNWVYATAFNPADPENVWLSHQSWTSVNMTDQSAIHVLGTFSMPNQAQVDFITAHAIKYPELYRHEGELVYFPRDAITAGQILISNMPGITPTLNTDDITITPEYTEKDLKLANLFDLEPNLTIVQWIPKKDSDGKMRQKVSLLYRNEDNKWLTMAAIIVPLGANYYFRPTLVRSAMSLALYTHFTTVRLDTCEDQPMIVSLPRYTTTQYSIFASQHV